MITISAFQKNIFWIIAGVDLVLGIILYWADRQMGKSTALASGIIIASLCGLFWLYLKKKRNDTKAAEAAAKKSVPGYQKKKKKKR